MTKDQSDVIEELFIVWFVWSSQYRPHLGAPRVSTYSRGFTSHDIYIDADDSDSRIEKDRAEQVDACIDSLPGEQRIAIGIHAGNKSTGNNVYKSLRYTTEQLHINYQAAKSAIFPMLMRRGLVPNETNSEMLLKTT
jgi:hypothetical protein